MVLLVAILPAEYGLDPTGIGGILGFTKLANNPVEGNTTGTNSTSLYKYRLTWPVVAEPGENRAGYTREGTTSNVFVNVDKLNVTRVGALLTWADDNETGGQRTKPDLFELQIIGPDQVPGEPDLGRNGADGAGNVSAGFDWRTPPPSREVRATTDEEAAAQADGLVPFDRSASGEWTVRITLHDAGDVDAGVQFPGPAGDEGNAWNLALTVESFRFDRGSLNESKEREDRVRLEIPPGTGLEYKFDMEMGAPMDYAWNTTGARLHYDFHGEARGDTSGAFISHKSGSDDRDEGSFVAPFAGTHGWFWENQGTESITVELVTAGVYTIIGKT